MYHVAIVLVPGYSMLAAIATVEIMRITNSLFPERRFSWEFAHLDKSTVFASNGMALEAPVHLRDLGRFDALMVCASFNFDRYDTPAVIGLIRAAARRGKLIGGIETGVYFLARAGLLDERPATAHFNSLPVFATLFPKVRFVRKIFTFSNQRMTCAGGISCVDMVLRLVGELFGQAVADRAASIMIYSNRRDQSADLEDMFTSQINGVPEIVRRACHLMESRIREPGTMVSVAKEVGISRRTLDRLFMRSFECSASTFFRRIRLARARKLIKSTDLDITSISFLCGFQSYSHFRKLYRDAYGMLPSSDRTHLDSPRDDTHGISPLRDLHPYQRL
ncbi:MAG: GlxA family transcriptional regulator [Pikeienuella sp.]